MIEIVYGGKKWFATGINKDGKIRLSSVNGKVETTCSTTEVFSDKGNKKLVEWLFPNPDKVLKDKILKNK